MERRGGDEKASSFPCMQQNGKFPICHVLSGWIVLLFFHIFFFCILFFNNNSSQSLMRLANLTTSTPQQAVITEQQTIPFSCAIRNLTCPSINITSHTLPPSSSCPDYFRWIHEDLRPWAETGITKDAVMRAKDLGATFNLIILNGRVYVERLRPIFQTRDIFTIWGIVQLVRRYPGRVPDLELMFNCKDGPLVKKADYIAVGAPIAPPLFRYCKDNVTLDIVFPDWSFWGWAEINIKPWDTLLKEIKEGNERTKWKDRSPYAYWKGNPNVAQTRGDLLKCNISESHDWNARIFKQDWNKEERKGYKNSNVADQCTHRYKIYIEGEGWSVSEKYILACDSPTLFVNSRFEDFVSRALIPGRHYWPVRDVDKCRSIKFAVDWGNSHQEEAQRIGKTASRFLREEMNMENVYDYMLHLLVEYSKLFLYKPVVPPGAVEYCSESMACPRKGRHREYMMESMVKAPHHKGPCSIPPPYDPGEMHEFLRMKANYTKRVEDLEEKAWKS